MKRKIMLLIGALMLLCAPVMASSSASAEYKTVSQQDEAIIAKDELEIQNYPFVASLVAGYVFGKAVDYVLVNGMHDGYTGPLHLCVSLPPEYDQLKVEEAFRR
ncbi:hypothetical protein [Sporosarcina sp. UB5]|uniref:hypothetical protein n=1 Tax=Sporosarcina sp. UB5 TaxID=3047463 RepID=UPI003D7AECFD